MQEDLKTQNQITATFHDKFFDFATKFHADNLVNREKMWLNDREVMFWEK